MVIDSSDLKDSLILVTGANGFVGTRLVDCLLKNGFRNLRCFVRPSGNHESLVLTINNYSGATIEIIKGNLLVKDDCKCATKDVSIVYHLAAGTGKSFSGCVLDSAVTTRNLLDALYSNTLLKRFVNVSSFSVYSNFKMCRGALLDETCPIDRNYRQRFDSYAFGKIKQEDIVFQYARERGIPYTILRPGVVFGPGRGGTILGRSGTDTFGFFMHITGRHKIPLTYVDNCADAIVRAGLVEGIDGEIFNVVDDDLPTSGALVRAVKRNIGPFFSVRVPYHLFYIFCSVWEKYSTWSHGQLQPVFNRRMCAASHKGNRFSNDKLKRLLGWKPIVPMDEALKRYFSYMKKNKKK
ncbi:MAG: NAD(P)-dependent oxidoreductase [Candidatus Thermoplasmatota archaeon]|nr:NAD(P)-dependent oxidoreductase [Candidatus Thermoplasmatota archaeon]